MKSKIITITEQGAPAVMRVDSVDVPDPGKNEVRVRQTAIGLNFMDIYHRSGAYSLALPSALGVEAAGVVDAVGDGVSEFRPGDRVGYGGFGPGAYAEYRNVPAEKLVTIPDGVTDEQAAAVLMKGMTVEYLLERAYPVRADQWVLFHAAAGGVGMVAGQWGKDLGARMIGVAGGETKCGLARDHGYEVVIDRLSEDVVARVKETTGGEGVPVVYDSVGGPTFEQSLECLAPRGFFVSFGTTAGPVPPVKAADLQQRGSLYFTRPTLVTYTANRDDLVNSAARVFAMVAKGAVKIEVMQRYALDEVVKAHEDLESGKTTGSSILIP